MPKFIKNKLKSDLDSDSDDKELMANLRESDIDHDSDLEAESNFDAKLMTKLKKLNSTEV